MTEWKPKMNRREFVLQYAEASGLPSKWAGLGFISTDGDYLIALPCDCQFGDCPGWAMVAPSSVNSHLEFYSPFRDTMRGEMFK